MVDEAKLARAGEVLKGQGQQDAPTTPADLAIRNPEAAARAPVDRPPLQRPAG